MLTLENTSGFDQETLDKMNAEISENIQNEINNMCDPSFVCTDDDYEVFEEYWEKKVLDKYGGFKK